MKNKILALVLVLCLPCCNYSFLLASDLFKNENPRDVVSLEQIKGLGNNQGNLISLVVGSNNFLSDDYKDYCAKQSVVAFTFRTPKKRPKERTNLDHPEFQFIDRDGTTRGRFKIKKEDIYLLHKGKKILPTKIFIAQWEFDSVGSNPVAYSNYSKHSSKFVSFPIPCTELASIDGSTSDTKLIIAKIYKDDKVIKEDIEFIFTIADSNRSYAIWLE